MRFILALLLFGAGVSAQQVVIKTSRLLDGKGGQLQNATIVIDGSKIRSVGSNNAAATYDLNGLTVMPGWIDTHVHIGQHLNREGRADPSKETPAQLALGGAGNLYATLMAGFTTVQSMGAMSDWDLRDMVERGILPGPRVLTSLDPLNERSGTPEQIRVLVRKRVEQGADFIKVFATKSIRDGGAQTMTDAQLEAACGEAKSLGKRVAVHAHATGRAKAAVLAGCTNIEHGAFLDNETLQLMAQRGIFFDPNLSTSYHYLSHQEAFLGTGNYTKEGFEFTQKALPIRTETVKRAVALKVKIVLGTDAVAGAHGHNAEEFIYRVNDAGILPMDAIVSATSRAAESMGLEGKVGAIAPGLEADLVAVQGNPLEDITAVRRVVFVMKAGKVYKNVR